MPNRAPGIVWRTTPDGRSKIPCLRIDVKWPPTLAWSRERFRRLQAAFDEAFSGDRQAPAKDPPSDGDATPAPAELLSSLLLRAARGVDSLVSDALAELHRTASGRCGDDWIELPIVDEVVAFESVTSCHGLIVDAMASDRPEPEARQAIAEGIGRIRTSLAVLYPKEPLPSAVLRARAARIPCSRLSRLLPVYGFGHGALQKEIWKGFSGATSYFGVFVATNKTLANELLRRAGIPVPPQRTVDGWERAKRAAAELGFPVVVKPQSTDFGTAVTTSIVSERQLREAFDEARRHGNVLVERHIQGTDHRILVMAGRALRAYKRLPAHVVGDGSSTVAELIDVAAVERRKVHDLRPYAFASKDDKQVLSMLERQGLSLSSVPGRGVMVVLRSNANVSTGGTTVSVADIIHPDNLRIAERAAEALNLDIAGVDFISPDISVSWLENGGAICEVNPTPGMPYVEDVDRLLDFLTEGGRTDLRIPIILFVGPDDEAVACQQALEDLAREFSFTLTTERSATLYQGGRRISTKCPTPQIAMEMALRDRSTDMLLLCHEDASFGGLPLAIDAVDVAFVSNACRAALDDDSRRTLADMSLTIIEGDEARLKEEVRQRLSRLKNGN